MKISKNGLDLIKNFEGFSAVPYKDVKGLLTIGFGHLIKEGEIYGAISSVEATAILSRDVENAEACINSNVTCKLSQNQFDALVSFVYNLGCVAFIKSSLLRQLNIGNTLVAANEFLKWCHAGQEVIQGLLTRRKKERLLFLTEE